MVSPVASPRRPMSKMTLQRWYFIGGIVFLFAIAVFANVTFYMRSTTVGLSSTHFRPGAHSHVERFVQHVAFTATCSERDAMRAQVLAFTAREQKFTGELTYIVYNCNKEEFNVLQKNIPKKYNIIYYRAAAVKGSGDKELNPHALHSWIQNSAKEISPETFVMIVEVDTIFTRSLDLMAMLKVADTMANPTMLAQDAAWFDIDNPSYIMPLELLEEVMGKSSKSYNTDFWRGNAVHVPFVMQSRHLDPVFSETKKIYSKLDQIYQHLAYPLACAELGLEHGVAGSFRLSRYNSFAENWNIVDQIQYNPLNETMAKDDPLFGEYPFTLRTNILQLTKWIDGASYIMRDMWIPRDFFHCDASLLELPPTSLWHYAKHTYGWEHVSSILRIRHVISISLSYSAYNRAAIDAKNLNCPLGFNSNQQLLLREDLTSAIPSRLPLHGLKTQPQADTPFHFVFTSKCTDSDQWQADMLVESFLRVKQPGQLTRIVIGCQTEQQMNQVLARTLPNTLLHFVPESIPFQTHALRHWLEESNRPFLPSHLVILSLEFLFLGEFSIRRSIPVVSSYPNPDEDPDPDMMQVIHGSQVPKEVFYYSGENKKLSSVEIVDGKTFLAQNFDSYLESYINETTINELCRECPAISPPNQWNEIYQIGLPFVLKKFDLKKTIQDACELTEKLAKKSPQRIFDANLIGFSIAASKNGIKPIRLDNLALTKSKNEDWHFVLAKKEINSFTIKYELKNPCEKDLIIPTNSAKFLNLYKRYHIDSWIIDIKLIPNDIFACDKWLLMEPQSLLWDNAIKSENELKIIETYGLCTTIKLWNLLLIQNKKRNCLNGFNFNKKLKLME